MDLSLRSGERQVADNIEGIRRDHLARYEWAAARLRDQNLAHVFRFVDVGCGIGYGANILASRLERRVWALDHSSESIEFGRQHFRHRMVFWEPSDWIWLSGRDDGEFHTATCFEMIEHVADPLPMLKAIRHAARRLIASVPNEDVLPFIGYKFHHRHYTKAEFEALLNAAGWRVTEWWGQAGPESEVERDCNGRTLIALCERAPEIIAYDTTNLEAWASSAGDESTETTPNHIVILGLGPSLEHYVDMVKRLGNRRAFSDEVWGINAVGDVINCDRIFHMDAVEVQQIRAEARPRSNIAYMLKWMRTHPGPIYTSTIPENNPYPGLVPYPLEDVINTTGFAYFNGTAAYAMAFAIYLGVKRISLYGCDFSYANSHLAEKGRGCLEFWLGIAAARGIEIGVSEHTSLLDACEPEQAKFYGYDCVDVNMETKDGQAKISFARRDKLPTADEIEARYDHSQPTSPHVRDK